MSDSSHQHMNHGAVSDAHLFAILPNVSDIVHGIKQAADHLGLSDTAKAHNMHGSHHHGGFDEFSSISNVTDSHGGGMKMYFHIGHDEYFFFESWHITTVGALIGAMIGIFCIAVLLEGIKFGREFLFHKSITSLRLIVEEANKGVDCNRTIPLQLSIWSNGHIIQTLLHMLQFLMSYAIMLTFMTYNVWLCLACVAGVGFGYFLFGWKKTVVVDVSEHCH